MSPFVPWGTDALGYRGAEGQPTGGRNSSAGKALAGLSVSKNPRYSGSGGWRARPALMTASKALLWFGVRRGHSRGWARVTCHSSCLTRRQRCSSRGPKAAAKSGWMSSRDRPSGPGEDVQDQHPIRGGERPLVDDGVPGVPGKHEDGAGEAVAVPGRVEHRFGVLGRGAGDGDRFGQPEAGHPTRVDRPDLI